MIRWYRRWLGAGLVAICSLTGLLNSPLISNGSSFETAPDIPWAQPTEMAVHTTGPVAHFSEQRAYDCAPLSYRMIDDITKTMRRGCFVTTAFGMFDPDSSLAIFNGTDEAIQIKYNGSPAAISPLPYSASVARFGGTASLGTYMHLYTYFPTTLTEGYDVLKMQRYKQISGSPGFTISDITGRPLALNTSAFAYAPRGQWFVAESPAHSLVRVNLATFDILPFAPSFYTVGNPFASHNASMAITGNGRYAAIASNEFSTLKVYDLKTCTSVVNNDPLTPQTCASHDYWSYVAAQVTGDLRKIDRVQFIDDGLISFQATTSTGTDSYLLAPRATISSLIPYLGVGDSYASGQGAWNYVLGTDTAINKCHLSKHSYPLRLNRDLFSSRGQSVACSGARIHDISSRSLDYTGQTSDQKTVRQREADGSDVAVLHDFTPGHLAQTSFINAYRPGVVTIQIGGNDIGFGDLLLRCVSPVMSLKPPRLNPNSCFASYEDRLEIEETINRTYGALVDTYRQAHNTSPASRIYVIGYPQIVSDAGYCGLNTPLTADDIRFAQYVIDYLNNVIQRAADAANVQYVDVADAFTGHRLCDNTKLAAMNGITAGTDAGGVLGQESFHPTIFGHDLLEQAILKKTRNLTSVKPINTDSLTPATSDNDPLLQAPRTGRAVKRIMPVQNITPASMTRGNNLLVAVKGIDSGFKDASTVTIQIGGIIIGTSQTNGQGAVQASLPIPDTLTPGIQPVVVSGTNQNGDPVDVTTMTYVNANDNDYDNDDIPNNQDSCPRVNNSGIDRDQDGIDDVCDSTIESPINASQPLSNNQAVGETALQPARDPMNSDLAVLKSVSISGRTKPLALTVKSVRASSILQNRSTKHNKSSIQHVPLATFLWYAWAIILSLLILAALVGKRLSNK